MRLRERIRRSLGDRYDLRGFNDAVVAAGNAPLLQLERSVNRALGRS